MLTNVISHHGDIAKKYWVGPEFAFRIITLQIEVSQEMCGALVEAWYCLMEVDIGVQGMKNRIEQQLGESTT